MPTMKALHAFTFARRRLRAGERFEAREEHANALRMAYLAVDDLEASTPQPQQPPKPTPAPIPSPIPPAQQPEPPHMPPKRGRGRPKGSYKRRDLVAE